MRRPSLSRFASDRRGVALVEFAFVLPLLILLSVVAFDLIRYVIYMRKVELAASTIADLVARNDTGTITQTDLQAIARAQLVIFPEAMTAARDSNTSVWSLLKWTLSGVQFRKPPTCLTNCTYVATVAWSAGLKRPCLTPLTSVANTAGPSPTTLPSETFGPGFLVVADVVFSYKPLIAQSVVGSIDIAKSFYVAPRYVSSIAFDTTGGTTSAGACPL
ncbi:TadE/TadG family type IV pilus assembly protein [Methylobacterium flocculans]|uniref:TadE/TadG family type IV pilus assembly protein n=1 Tax=Methylobacterium flocculans TaxID=2984843 RepID=UPI0021F39E57|nr:TadE/TadG family type IV pilus assembly protein [Methylobacterium sp. FF17]